MSWESFKQMIITIDWTAFHFLRPKALYLFLPLAAVMLLLFTGNREQKKWKVFIAEPLRRYMFSKGSHKAILLPLFSFATGISFMILGVAGPAWKKKEIPGQKIQTVVLVALDLSRSMLATDLEPDRIARAKFKLADFLDANPRARAGLIAYAGTPHLVLPFTGDYKLIKFQAQSLVNRIMPVQGTNLEALFQEVDMLMKRIEAPSTILLMTDQIDTDDAIFLSNWVNQSIHRLEILLISTPGGAVVPGFPQVLSRQDPAILGNLAQDSAIRITPLTLDQSDVKGIASRISKQLFFEKEQKNDSKQWDDQGALFLVPSLIIASFWFRKGWAVQWCLFLVLTAGLSSCGLESKHPDWWYTQNYQGQLLENMGNYSAAAEHFLLNQNKAAAYYKAGNYAAAADLFALDPSADGNYNSGLALAKLNRFAAAEEAFNRAVKLDTALRTKVKSSLEAAKSLQKRTDSILRYNPVSVNKRLHDQEIAAKKKHKDDPLKERKPSPQDEQLSADTRVEKLPGFGDRLTDQVLSNIHGAREAKSSDKNPVTEKSDQLASNILLRRAAADPAEFLHKRFLLQEKLSDRKVAKSRTPW